ncbi:hypothetical protein K6T82_06940 [Flavobacterium sp. 17A]|uniref:Uncharacterized protein n=1 Tax=Flavobacterium potami TaxID=2872310 RepID=A0A9X1KPH5_9FLAO|nr:hypothetical protein [Flavobacterium potami]MBZ4034495.1 hypothetical protein [Flavobacterium potami]
MKNLNKLLRRAILIKKFRNIKTLDRELFLRCKPIKSFIKKNNISDKEAMLLPPVIIGAVLGNKFKIDVTRYLEDPIAKKLEAKLNTIGKIGKHNGINVVGKCAEVNSSNYLLLRKKANLSEINFTNPYRPRTSEIIETCLNCQNVFN